MARTEPAADDKAGIAQAVGKWHSRRTRIAAKISRAATRLAVIWDALIQFRLDFLDGGSAASDGDLSLGRSLAASNRIALSNMLSYI